MGSNFSKWLLRTVGPATSGQLVPSAAGQWGVAVTGYLSLDLRVELRHIGLRVTDAVLRQQLTVAFGILRIRWNVRVVEHRPPFCRIHRGNECRVHGQFQHDRSLDSDPQRDCSGPQFTIAGQLLL